MAIRSIAAVSKRPLCVMGVALVAVGCGVENSRPSGDSVTSAYQRLAEGAAACGEEASRCVRDAAGDPGELQACEEAFASCREQNVEPEADALAEAIRACTEAAARCREAGNPPASCARELSACTGEARPSGNPEDAGADDADAAVAADAGMADPEPGGPVASCIDRLHECIRNGEPSSCARQVAPCVQAELEVPRGRGPQRPRPDAGMQDPMPEPPDGDAGEAPQPPTMEDDTELTPEPMQDCREQVESCIQAGGMPPQCAREVAGCVRADRS